MACFTNATRHRVGCVQSSIGDAKRFSSYKEAQKDQNTDG
jgi:hypothetical protein